MVVELFVTGIDCLVGLILPKGYGISYAIRVHVKLKTFLLFFCMLPSASLAFDYAQADTRHT